MQYFSWPRGARDRDTDPGRGNGHRPSSIPAPLARAGKSLAVLAVCALAGALLTRALGAAGLHRSSGFAFATTALLAIGLYAGTHGIDLSHARRNVWLLARVLTVGVVLKAALIGVVLALIFADSRLLILGVVMAQIDPLSVSALERDARLSAPAKSILRAWSSFDDPVTVLLAWLLIEATARRSDDAQGPLVYAQALAVNVILAAAVAFVFWTTKRLSPRSVVQRDSRPAMRRERLESIPALLLGFGLGVATTSMLAVAVMGLIVRPRLGRLIERVALAALCLAAAALGTVLAADVGGGEELAQGVTLGALAYAAQVAVAPLLACNVPTADRWHLALAQQNGITAIILALSVAVTIYPAAGVVVAIAILAVTLLHALANTAWDLRQQRRLR